MSQPFPVINSFSLLFHGIIVFIAFLIRIPVRIVRKMRRR